MLASCPQQRDNRGQGVLILLKKHKTFFAILTKGEKEIIYSLLAISLFQSEGDREAHEDIFVVQVLKTKSCKTMGHDWFAPYQLDQHQHQRLINTLWCSPFSKIRLH